MAPIRWSGSSRSTRALSNRLQPNLSAILRAIWPPPLPYSLAIVRTLKVSCPPGLIAFPLSPRTRRIRDGGGDRRLRAGRVERPDKVRVVDAIGEQADAVVGQAAQQGTAGAVYH